MNKTTPYTPHYIQENATIPPHPDQRDEAYYAERGVLVPLPVEIGDNSKKDAGKARYDLIPPEALDALADLYAIGAAKYADRGWEAGMKWGRIFSAMMRHAWKWWSGEKFDRVDGQHHLAAVAWGAFALYTYECRQLGEDDRAGS